MKNPLAIFSLFGIGTGALGFIYPASRRVILSFIFVLCVSVLVDDRRKKRPLRLSLVMGLLIMPVVTAAFFFRYPADLVFCTVILFFGAILVLSTFRAVSERQKLLAAYITFIGALVAATVLNYRAILQTVTGQ